VSTIAAYGLAVDVPAGWEGSIYRRPQAAAGTTHPVMHVASFALPVDRGDFGSGAVDLMEPDDALVVLLEYHGASGGQALFGRQGLPLGLAPDAFSTTTLQRGIPGHAGGQWFFNDGGRPFCLYVVLGSYALRYVLVPAVNEVLARIRIEPASAWVTAE
jgi:hypothetical protein